jgi:GT2 family glycosyltransferase/glycosyltransferase involved in cell wall biosynthesis
MNGRTATPLISVIMANLNGAAHIAEAVRSVLRQTERSLELIVSDDGSSDDSLEKALRAASGDPRLVLLKSERVRTGPAATRNRALAIARGSWIALVDNDDVIHPERLERLIRTAEADGADIAADDLLVFYQDQSRAPHAHLRGAVTREPHWIGAAEYERSNQLLSGRRALGYLKPVLRRSLAPVYDESLRIGEDSDLILRLLVNGARMRVYPELGYFYRKHARSISHRLDAASIAAMEVAYARIDASRDAPLAREIAKGAAARAGALAFTALVGALKARNLAGALAIAAQRPSALRLLKDPIVARLPKARANAPSGGAPRITLLSRQRVVGSTNGSSAYLLAIATALQSAGYAVDYIGASPAIFGRWAVLRLKPETQVFGRYLVHGGVRIGNFVLARSWRIWAASTGAVLAAMLGKVGLSTNWSKPAPPAQRAPATRADQLFIARHAAPNAGIVVCDYGWLTPLAPYALADQSRRFVIMHDLMSARVRDAAKADDAYDLSAEDEFRLLSHADVVVAIQEEEARAVRGALPGVEVVVAPHAAEIGPAAQPGDDDTLLFVGSNTPPNVTALEHFFAKTWPAIRARQPQAKLVVAGSVNRAFGSTPEGVTFGGVVADLGPLYRNAGVVISPLVTGSGLKIKLIEAMAAGKAVVGTNITAQGVHHLVADAMVIEDDPERFAEATVRLMNDYRARRALGAHALACAREHFSPEACFRDLVAAVGARAPVSAGITANSIQNPLREAASASQ